MIIDSALSSLLALIEKKMLKEEECLYCKEIMKKIPSVEELAKIKLPYPATFTYASAIGVEPKVYEITLSYESAAIIHNLLTERIK